MKKSNKEPSQRQLRAGELIRHIIAESLSRGHFHHEVLINANGISCTEVRCSPDLRNATAYVMSLGGENLEKILVALNAESNEFQKDINRNSNLKFTPRVRFKRDETFDEVDRIESLLRDIKK